MKILYRGVYFLALVGLAAGLKRISLKRSLTLRENVENEMEKRGLGDESREMIYRKLYEERTQRGDLNVYNLDNMMYYALIEIGTPAQYFNVCLDTGSSDLWVPSSKCPDDYLSCYFDDKYNARGSTTYRADGTPLAIEYGLGEVSGHFSRDIVKLGDLTVINQPFGEATEVDNMFLRDQPSDGILGLGYPRIAGRQPTFLKSLVTQRQIDKPIFSFYLDDNTSDNHESFLTFGEPDEDLYSGDIVYTPVTQKTHWHFNLKGVSIDGETTELNQDAIADTGTSLVYGPSSVVDLINDKLEVVWSDESGVKFVNCKSILQGPIITLNIGGSQLKLEPSQYILKFTSDVCISGFTAGDRFGLWIIGSVILRWYYSIYDMSQNRLGFAKAKIPNQSRSFIKPHPTSSNSKILEASVNGELIRMIVDSVEEEIMLKSLNTVESVENKNFDNKLRSSPERNPKASAAQSLQGPGFIPNSWRVGTQLSVPVPKYPSRPEDQAEPIPNRRAVPGEIQENWMPVPKRSVRIASTPGDIVPVPCNSAVDSEDGPIPINQLRHSKVPVPKRRVEHLGTPDQLVPVPNRSEILIKATEDQVPIPNKRAVPLDTLEELDSISRTNEEPLASRIPVPKHWMPKSKKPVKPFDTLIDLELLPNSSEVSLGPKVPVPKNWVRKPKKLEHVGTPEELVPVPHRYEEHKFARVPVPKKWVPVPKFEPLGTTEEKEPIPYESSKLWRPLSKTPVGTPEELIQIPHTRESYLESSVSVEKLWVPKQKKLVGTPEELIPVPHRRAIPVDNPDWEHMPYGDHETGDDEDNEPVPNKRELPFGSKDPVPIPNKKVVPFDSYEEDEMPTPYAEPFGSKGPVPIGLSNRRLISFGNGEERHIPVDQNRRIQAVLIDEYDARVDHP